MAGETRDEIGELLQKIETTEKISQYFQPGMDISWFNVYGRFFGEYATVSQIQEILGRNIFESKATEAIGREFEKLLQDKSMSRSDIAQKVLEYLQYQEKISRLIYQANTLQEKFSEPLPALLKIKTSLTLKTQTHIEHTDGMLVEEEERLKGYEALIPFVKNYYAHRDMLPVAEQNIFDTFLTQAVDFSTNVTPQNIAKLSGILNNAITQVKSQKKETETPSTLSQKEKKQFHAVFLFLYHPDFPGKVLKNGVDDICALLGIEDKAFKQEMKSNPPEIVGVQSIEDILGFEKFIDTFLASGVSEKTLKNIFKQTLIPGHIGTFKLLSNKKIKAALGVDAIFEILEGKHGLLKGGVTLSQCIKEFGFPHRLQKALDHLFSKYLKIEMTPKYWNNTMKLINFFLSVESSGGYNVANYAGDSSANGYLQYLVGNGYMGMEELDDIGNAKQVVRYSPTTHGKLGFGWSKKTKDIPSRRVSRQKSSYDAALIATAQNKAIWEMYPNLEKEYKNIGNPKKQNILGLGSEEQIVIFLSDILEKKNQTYFHSLLKSAIVDGSSEAAKKLYDAHHTNTHNDTATAKLRDNALRKVYIPKKDS